MQHGYPNINDIISYRKIIPLFQPIISIIKKNIVGFESLARGIDENNGTIPPSLLFSLAEEQGLTIELDRLCRETALRCYAQTYARNKEILFFINLDSSIIDRVIGSNHLYNTVTMLGLSPQNIVIELNETSIIEINALKAFSNTYREHGFLIALDDVGSGFSNLDRVLIIQPDIIKVDKGLISNIHNDYYKQEVFKSLVNLSKKIGSIVVAEGIETLAEAIVTVDLGADMLQGYYFSKPVRFNGEFADNLSGIINETAEEFKLYVYSKIKQEKAGYNAYDIVMESIKNQLSLITVTEFDSRLNNIICHHPTVECIYILDKSGIQVSNTICQTCFTYKKNLIFQPAKRGQNHSLKKYYYSLSSTGINKYLTSSYISLATGNSCITLSAKFNDLNGDDYILCIDFNAASIYDLDTAK